MVAELFNTWNKLPRQVKYPMLGAAVFATGLETYSAIGALTQGFNLDKLSTALEASLGLALAASIVGGIIGLTVSGKPHTRQIA